MTPRLRHWVIYSVAFAAGLAGAYGVLWLQAQGMFVAGGSYGPGPQMAMVGFGGMAFFALCHMMLTGRAPRGWFWLLGAVLVTATLTLGLWMLSRGVVTLTEGTIIAVLLLYSVGGVLMGRSAS